jgi:hypothetical protein
MTIPTKQDWGIIDKNDLDAMYAYKNFYGRSTSQVYKFFVENALHYQEDLLSMPIIPFNYYAQIFADYIISQSAKEDSDGASSYLHFIVEMLTSFKELPTSEIKKKLLCNAKIVAEQQEYYDADPCIYGDFLNIYKQVARLSNVT